MREYVRGLAPEEACGLLAGKEDQVRMVFPITNIYHSPIRYRMDPEQQLRAFLLAEEKELDIQAVFHSHPHGLGEPSATDLEELTYPGIYYLIWFVERNLWQCRGFMIHSRFEVGEAKLLVTD